MKKKSISLILSLVMLLSLLLSVNAAAADNSFDIKLELDKEEYLVGETITVKVIVTADSDTFNITAFQDTILFNKGNMEYIDSSNNANNEDSYRITSSSSYYNINYESVGIMWNGLGVMRTYSEPLVVAELQFKAVANTSSARLLHSRASVFGASTKAAPTTTNNAYFIIGLPDPPTYPINFSAGGGSGSAPALISNEAAEGDVFVLPLNSYTREGYNFQGWSDGRSVYNPGASYTMPGQAVTFTATWEKPASTTVEVVMLAGGASGTAPVMPARNPGDLFALPTQGDLTYAGHTFVGWSYNGNTYQPGELITMPSTPVTITAVWQEDANAGETPPTTSPTTNTEDETVDDGGTNQFGKRTVKSTVIEGTTYNNPFLDIDDGDWFFHDVVLAFNQGLINGMSSNTYEPDSNLTLAQAIKLAACLHQLNSQGSVSLTNALGNWYQSYVDYAIANGIISQGFADYNQTATRAQFAEIFASALPQDRFEAINTVSDGAIPDVRESDSYGPAVYKLYRAGILTGYTGNDVAEGSFKPGDSIKRSEVAAILTRMYNDSARKTVSLG